MSFFKNNLKQFKDINLNDTCYIFGDGVSMKSYKLKYFNNIPSICCGKIFLRSDFNFLNTYYYTIPEPRLFLPKIFQKRQYIIDNQIVNKLLKKKFSELNDIIFFLNVTNSPSISGSNINYIHRITSKMKREVKNTNNDPFSGSFITTLSLAYHFGFKKVYLIGFDSFTQSTFTDIRWYEYGKLKNSYEGLKIKNSLIDLYKNKMDITSVLIEKKESINFKSISYEEFTGESPVYQENHKLTSREHLKVLSTQPSYNIFK
mgnify:FL=1